MGIDDIKNQISFALKSSDLQIGFEIICKRLLISDDLIYELHQCLLLKSSLEGHREPFATRVALALDRAEKYLSEVK